MKKVSLLLLLMLAVFIPSKGQETIELTFTANTQGGMYCPFDAVNVTNVTRGWTETLAYPDTVLVLNSTVGIGEQQYEEAIHLGEAYPNPFTEETNAPLDMPFTGEVSIQVVRIDGTVVATSRNHLEAGSYRVKVSLSSPAMAFLVVTSTQGRQVVRMLCTKSGGRDSITLEPVSREYKPSIQLVRGSTSGEFQPGDMMRYTSVLFDGANTVYSNTITQPQYESEIITMLFDLTLPEVITSQVTNITQNTATGGGNVTATGGVSVTERGICWSTSHNPTISSSHASNGLGAGSYTVQMSGLTAGTTYFVRAYAINRFGTAYGNEVSFTTTQIPSYTISVSANPTNGGTVSGGGSYQQGQSCTVIATAANGYSFNNWTENGSVVSTNPNYSFTVNNNRSLVANFSVQAPNTYTINASPNPSNGGLVTGGGTYQQGQSCTVSAVANTGYTFLRWTENGNQVSTNANYTFTVTSNRTLVAQFQLQSFTISATVTPSNSGTVTGGGSYNYGQLCTLMATANTGYVFEKWTKNGTQISTEATYSFTVTESASYVAHFQLQNYTINVSANPTNGGSVTGAGSYNYGQSCTITATAAPNYTFLRWTENGNQVSTNASYTFTVTDNRYLVAQFQAQSYTITASANPTNGGSVTGGGSYNYGQSCTVSATPATGYTFTNWTENGSVVSTNATYTFTVNANRDMVANFSVQAPNTYSISVSSNPTTGGSVTGGGTYQQGQSCMVSATANTGYTFTNWTENGSVVSTNANYTFTVTSNRTLVAQFQLNDTIPTVTTAQITNITPTTASGGGNVTASGGANVTERGICWSTSHNPTTSDSHASSGSGTGSFTVSMTGLTANTIYYVRAYAINSVGTAYGEEVGFTTLQEITLPSVTTNGYVFPITQTTAQAFGFVDSMGNGWVSERGICWSTSHNPTTSGSHANNGQGTGSFGVEITGLTPNTTYYIRAYAINEAGTAYGDEVSFTTLSNIINYSITVIPIPTAGGTVTGGGIYQQGQSCTISATANTGYTFVGWTENDIVVSTNANYTFTVNSDRTLVAYFSAQAPNTYTISVSSSPTNGGTVTGGGTYQQGQSCTVSATAATGYTFTNWTENGSVVSTNANYTFTVSNNRSLVAHFSAQAPNTYTISVSSSPTNGGSVGGGGTYQQGQSCTVSATANSGYTFVNWTENGNQVSSNANYTFTVNSNRTLVANFSAQAPTYTISVSPYPTSSGSVLGGGSYNYGQSCTVTATAAPNYTFLWWTENGIQVSTNANYTFTVTSDRTLVARFSINQPPTGAINGLFTINANGDQIFFSKGNLRYQASTGSWRFATNQYDYIGNDNSNISQTYDGWIDLFGWGTSGWNCGSTYYRPWDFEYSLSGYGPPEPYNLTDEYANSDWGLYNAIDNGGYQTGIWRTLTDAEWSYVFDQRNTVSGNRYAKAQVNGVNGVILLPDDWNTSCYNLSYYNNSSVSFIYNVIGYSSWKNILEAHGCVFLPAAGSRNQTLINNVGSHGEYWSASHHDNYSGSACGVHFYDSYLSPPQYYIPRFAGCSVRLVKDY